MKNTFNIIPLSSNLYNNINKDDIINSMSIKDPIIEHIVRFMLYDELPNSFENDSILVLSKKDYIHILTNIDKYKNDIFISLYKNVLFNLISSSIDNNIKKNDGAKNYKIQIYHYSNKNIRDNNKTITNDKLFNDNIFIDVFTLIELLFPSYMLTLRGAAKTILADSLLIIYVKNEARKINNVYLNDHHTHSNLLNLFTDKKDYKYIEDIITEINYFEESDNKAIYKTFEMDGFDNIIYCDVSCL